MTRAPEDYPELGGFTERLLVALDEHRGEHQVEHHGRAGAPGAPAAASVPPGAGAGRGRRATARRLLRPAVAAAAAALVALTGFQLAGGGGGPAGDPGGGPSGRPSDGRVVGVERPETVRTLGQLALVAARQPARPEPSGPVQSVLSERIEGGPRRIDDRGNSFVVLMERRVTELRRRDGLLRWEYGTPKVQYPTARARELYERWRASLPSKPVKPDPAWPRAFVWEAPDGSTLSEFVHDHDDRIGRFQRSDGSMWNGIPAADLATDPAALRRQVLRAIAPFTAASSAERDMIGKVGTRQDVLMSFMLELLTNDAVGPRQRAAAFRMLASIEEIEVVPDARDRAGRPGIGIRWQDTRPSAEATPTLWIFDRQASRLLGTESTVTRAGHDYRGYSVILRERVTR